jgi:Na+/H+ antiporter NhaC
MRRFLPGTIAVLLLVGAWFLPEPGAPRLAALSCHEFLTWPVGEEPDNILNNGEEEEEDLRRPLWEHVLTGPAARDEGEGRRELRIGGMLVGGDLLATVDMRRSVVRGFRDLSPEELLPLGIQELVILGEHSPEPGGVFLRLDAGEGMVRLTSEVDGVGGTAIDLLRPWSPPDRGSLFPPLVAVAIAILLRRPLLALFSGVFVGAILLRHAAEASLAGSIGGGFVDVFKDYFWDKLIDPERALTIGFVFFMLAMVGVMTRSGGVQGLMDAIARRARSARGTQVAAWLMGLAIFFDDYANTILVGSTMRPLSDRFRVAREKLAYIVDSTAAPVAGLSVFSTWIAFEVSTFSAHLPAAGLTPADGYAIFFRSIPYSFYCILTLFFVGFVVLSRRDFGPMLDAERRARHLGLRLRKGATPMVSESATAMEAAPGIEPRAWRALAPLLTFLGVTLLDIARRGGAFESGAELSTIEGITGILYGGSGYWPLFSGSLAGFFVAALGAATAGLRSDIARASWTTVRAMGVAFAILYLAWMIGAVCGDLGTASFLTSLVGDAIDPLLLPSLLFLIAGVVAFATGSSWSTMSILLPLVVGLSYALGLASGLEATAIESGRTLMVICISAVLSGAIFGDHCSPISDTTVMSSIASASDHIDHVRTQAPYALLTMVAALLFGYLPCTYFRLDPWLCSLGGILFLLGFLFLFGRIADDEGAPESPP